MHTFVDMSLRARCFKCGEDGVRVFRHSVYCIPLHTLTSTKPCRLSLSEVIVTNICVKSLANDCREMWRGKRQQLQKDMMELDTSKFFPRPEYRALQSNDYKRVQSRLLIAPLNQTQINK